MGDPQIKLSVVIVNYNVCDLLLSCVESLHVATQTIPSEIIVVDNASTDGAVEALAANYPDVVVLPLPSNIGFGRANNHGFGRARGEYILILNPDTIVQEDTIRVMLEFMEHHPDATFAGCRIILPDGTLDPVSKRGFPSPWSSFCRVFGLSRLFPRSRLFGGYNLTYIPDDVTSPVDALAGCFMFCRAEALRRLGGFDPDFFMYGEDLDLCYRARQAGGRIYYHPSTSILHLKGESTRRSSIDALAVFYEAMEIFARKHFKRNPLLLLLVRLGIRLRRTAARFGENFPGWPYAAVDVVAAISGFVLGSLLKFGTPFSYPGWAVPVVWGVPPAVFIGAIALAGGYGRSDRTPGRALLGVLLGFLVLSALPYFFKEYAFSRGVVLVTTVVVALIGVTWRYGSLLWSRTVGTESIRRVAIVSRGVPDRDIRQRVRRQFVTRPVMIVGTIAPTVSEMESSRTDELGSVDNIVRSIDQHRLTDIVVVDSGLEYSEVIRAMELAGHHRVRFHVLHRSGERTIESSVPGAVHIAGGLTGGERTRRHRRLRDRGIAAFLLVLAWPAVYWAARRPARAFGSLFDVVMGRRPLVGSGAAGPEPVFAMKTLAGASAMGESELAELDAAYTAGSSFLLDAEIVIGNLRLARASAAAHANTGVEESIVGRPKQAG